MIDNRAVVDSFARKWCKHEKLMAYVFEICILAIKYKFEFYVDWISSKNNFIADALSRFDMKTLLLAQKLGYAKFENRLCLNKNFELSYN